MRAGISLMLANEDLTFHCAYKPNKNAGAMNRKYNGSKIILLSHSVWHHHALPIRQALR
jgi:hypothetical protein